jgi:ABC-2 type transport system permease protein
MISTVLKISLLYLLRDRVALVLTFVLPLIFFSVFAAVFAPMDSASTLEVETIVVAEPGPSFAGRLADRLSARSGLAVERRGAGALEEALEAVRTGDVAAVVVLPDGLRPPFAGSDGDAVALHIDRSNPLAAEMVQGALQASAAEIYAATLLSTGGVAQAGALLPVELHDTLGGAGSRPSIAFFAAGLGVMFLMFAVTGRSAILIEEREHGVLGRLMAARVGMTRLLFGRWLFLIVLGTVQVLVMFLWAALVFGLDLFSWRHLTGFLVTTVATAAAAAAFGLILSAACRTRTQLNGVAVVSILTLSVVGGNMFPAFLMPAGLQAVGRLTFNAWALEAYRKVFWYDRAVAELAPQIAALAVVSLVFFAVARWIARRWERAGGARA